MKLNHFRFNINNVYMTLMMVTPMALLMLVGMWDMFPAIIESQRREIAQMEDILERRY